MNRQAEGLFRIDFASHLEKFKVASKKLCALTHSINDLSHQQSQPS
jgi:hypothetical protein